MNAVYELDLLAEAIYEEHGNSCYVKYVSWDRSYNLCEEHTGNTMCFYKTAYEEFYAWEDDYFSFEHEWVDFEGVGEFEEYTIEELYEKFDVKKIIYKGGVL